MSTVQSILFFSSNAGANFPLSRPGENRTAGGGAAVARTERMTRNASPAGVIPAADKGQRSAPPSLPKCPNKYEYWAARKLIENRFLMRTGWAHNTPAECEPNKGIKGLRDRWQIGVVCILKPSGQCNYTISTTLDMELCRECERRGREKYG